MDKIDQIQNKPKKLTKNQEKALGDINDILLDSGSFIFIGVDKCYVNGKYVEIREGICDFIKKNIESEGAFARVLLDACTMAASQDKTVDAFLGEYLDKYFSEQNELSD